MKTTIYYDANGRIRRTRSYIPDPIGVTEDEVGYLRAETPGVASDYYVQLGETPTLVKRLPLVAEFTNWSAPAGGSCSIELPADDKFDVMTSIMGVIARQEVTDGHLALTSATPGRMQVTIDGVKYQKRLYFLRFT